MLGWLAAAAAPILIQLLSRRKYRETPWAAMEFLRAAVKRRSRRIRFEQWLLLAVRTLLIVLVVSAVAEPYVDSSGMALSPGQGVHHVMVFDGSFSMAYKPADKSRFDRAKELARRIVEESSRSDAFSLMLMSRRPRVIVNAALDRAAILREIDDLRLSDEIAELPPAVARLRWLVDETREQNPRLDRHEVYFLTDLQRTTWAPKLSETARVEFLRQTSELANSAALIVYDVGRPHADNLAVVDLRPVDPPVLAGRVASLRVSLKDFGRRARPRQNVDLLVDGRRIARKEVDVSPGGSAEVEFSYLFDAPGDHSIEVAAPGDALDIDNHRFLALPVRREIRVLCIDGRPSGERFQGAADYLAVALAPREQLSDNARLRVETAAESALLERNLADYDCLFLCNVARFSAGEAHALSAYLQGGGGVVFFLGDRVRAESYNRELGVAGQGSSSLKRGATAGLPSSAGENFRKNTAGQASSGTQTPGDQLFQRAGRAGGVEILPARLGKVVYRPQFRLDPLGFRHPILQAFRGRGQSGLLTTPVFKYYQLELPNDSSATTVLAMADCVPLIVERRVGQGRVVLVATSAEPGWSALPLWPSFVPLVQEIAAFCAADRLQRCNVMVGDRAALSFADTAQSGIYVVRFDSPPGDERTFAVNVDPLESNLARIEPEELRAKVWPEVPFQHQTVWQDLDAAAVGGTDRSESGLHVVLLYCVLGLLLADTFFGWKLGH